jgi:8-oxo-dGTP diphosphatase
MSDVTSDWGRYLIVAAVVRRADQVLLVGHESADGVVWSLPAGNVDPDETVLTALAREMREETGLDVRRVAHLAYVANVMRSGRHDTTVALVFEIDADGILRVDDPDSEVAAAEFVDTSTAIERLRRITPAMGRPAIDYLTGILAAGSFAMYVDDEYSPVQGHATRHTDPRPSVPNLLPSG